MTSIIGGFKGFHRADVQRVFLKHIPPSCRIHFSKRLVNYQESADDVRMDFEDGSSAICNLLVGADGIKSTVRGVLLRGLAAKSLSPSERAKYEESVHPIWTGTIAYRGLVSFEVLSEVSPQHRTLTTPVMVRRLTLFLPSRIT